MHPIFFFITGQNLNSTRKNLQVPDEPAFSLLEIASLIEAYFPGFKPMLQYDLFRIIQTDVPSIDAHFMRFMERCVSIRMLGTLDFQFASNKVTASDAITDLLEKLAQSEAFIEFIRSLRDYHETFAIDRVYCTANIPRKAEQLIKNCMGQLVSKHAGLAAKLDDPDVAINAVVTYTRESPRKIMLIISFCSTHAHFKDYAERLAKNRPVFEIGTMNPPLTSLMVNICHPRIDTGSLVFDPFCGSGGILIEALVRGIYTIGLDVDWAAISGCVKNLKYYNKGMKAGFNILHASMFMLPFREKNRATSPRFDIVTDPPYGRMESLKNVPLERYIEEMMSLSSNKMCFAIPEDTVAQIFAKIQENLYYEIKNMQEKREHPGFARAIVLIEKTH